jgi:hypothetical protein
VLSSCIHLSQTAELQRYQFREVDGQSQNPTESPECTYGSNKPKGLQLGVHHFDFVINQTPPTLVPTRHCRSSRLQITTLGACVPLFHPQGTVRPQIRSISFPPCAIAAYGGAEPAAISALDNFRAPLLMPLRCWSEPACTPYAINTF